MKKMSLLIIILLLMAACNPTEPSEETKVKEPSLEEPHPDPNEQPKENNETEKEEDGGSDFEQNQPEGESPKAQPKSEEETTGKIIQIITEENMEKFSRYVHPEKGVLFSPYIYIDQNALTFDREQVNSLLKSDVVHHWGTFDGSGEAMELTANQYFETFIQIDLFTNPDEVIVNEMKQRGNMLNNVKEVFPNSKTVEFYVEGTETMAGMDWKSLLFVFEEYEKGLKLVAIVHDSWTI